jgi:hypothetical protein
MKLTSRRRAPRADKQKDSIHPSAGDGVNASADATDPHEAVGAAVPNEPKHPKVGLLLEALLRSTGTFLCLLGTVLLLPTPSPDRRLASLLCLVGFLYLYWNRIAPGRSLRCLVALAAIAVICVSPVPWLGMLGFILPASSISVCSKPLDRSIAYGLVPVLSLIYVELVMDSSGLVWQEASNLSWNATRRFSSLQQSPHTSGPIQSGMIWSLIAINLWTVQVLLFFDNWKLQVRQFLVLCIGIVSFLISDVTSIIYVTVFILVFSSHWKVPQFNLTLMRAVFPGVLLVCAIAALVTAAVGIPVERKTARTITIIDGGMKSINLPGTDVVKDDSEAAFSALRLLAPVYGWEFRVIPATFEPSQVSAGTGILCVINPTTNYSQNQKAAIERHVRSGGCLLVLGDHTDIGGIMGPINDLLRFTSIRLEFDSAIPEDKDWQWKGGLRGGMSFPFWRVDNDRLHISVGASLTCGPRSQVLVVGDRAFADIGRPNYGVSRLGDMAYERSREKRGGLPLVAEEAVGPGSSKSGAIPVHSKTRHLLRHTRRWLVCLSDYIPFNPQAFPATQHCW